MEAWISTGLKANSGSRLQLELAGHYELLRMRLPVDGEPVHTPGAGLGRVQELDAEAGLAEPLRAKGVDLPLRARDPDFVEQLGDAEAVGESTGGRALVPGAEGFGPAAAEGALDRTV
jgi:hypothetical protein